MLLKTILLENPSMPPWITKPHLLRRNKQFFCMNLTIWLCSLKPEIPQNQWTQECWIIQKICVIQNVAAITCRCFKGRTNNQLLTKLIKSMSMVNGKKHCPYKIL